MSQQTNPTTGDFHPAMWTYQIYDGYWRVYRRGVELGTVLSELNANSIVAAANEAEQQLAQAFVEIDKLREQLAAAEYQKVSKRTL